MPEDSCRVCLLLSLVENSSQTMAEKNKTPKITPSAIATLTPVLKFVPEGEGNIPELDMPGGVPVSKRLRWILMLCYQRLNSRRSGEKSTS